MYNNCVAIELIGKWEGACMAALWRRRALQLDRSVDRILKDNMLHTMIFFLFLVYPTISSKVCLPYILVAKP